MLISDIKISYLNKAFYHYVQYETSLTNSFNMNTLQSCKRYIDFLCTLLASDSFPVVKSKEMIKRNVFKYKVLSGREIVSLYPEIKTITDSSIVDIIIYKLAFSGYYLLADSIIKFRFILVKMKLRLNSLLKYGLI